MTEKSTSKTADIVSATDAPLNAFEAVAKTLPRDDGLTKEELEKLFVFRYNGDRVSYALSANSRYIEGCVTIPSQYSSLPVTRVEEGAFRDCYNLKTVYVGQGVREVGPEAFARCSDLYSVCLPESLLTLGRDVFSDCISLKYVYIPQKITFVPTEAFAGCASLGSIFLPERVSTISRRAFSGCSDLTSIVIDGGLRSVASRAFENCASLKKVFFNGTPAQWRAVEVDREGNNALFNAEIVFEEADRLEKKESERCLEFRYNPDGATCSVSGFCNDPKTLSLPSWTCGVPVTEILADAFVGCKSLVSVVIPRSVKKIAKGAFAKCDNLTRVTMPKRFAGFLRMDAEDIFADSSRHIKFTFV